ncbi:class I SAM-dependent methyltransferase [Solwaraspora sp. WMMD406]|uniref:class I SAM-dependent methyltransferase n=1 Tax=Solwaraspora sp. WMMD406 TaxID=3016095 RepID=UPI00241787AD|nr:class I SAM-dependent methyltransferase [Solwaraspora sp. WMMD406]MDG4765257.1 class I SAM-dependent methyltransferase [Solwaraspora sp. WMMD406]
MSAGDPVSAADPVGAARALRHRDWDEQYRTGRWDYLGDPAERYRFTALAGQIHRYAPDSVLDLGCGQGLLYEALGGPAFAGRYVGVDWSAAALPPAARAARAARPARHGFVCADLTRLPLRASFDLAVLGEVLYYLPDPVAALADVDRLLVPGGRLLLSIYRPRPDRPGPWPAAVDALVEALVADGAAHLRTIVEPHHHRRWSFFLRQRRMEGK